MTPQSTAVADRLAAAFRDADWETITSTYAPDVLLDLNLPTWRFQLQGRDAATQYFVESAKGFSNLRCTQHRVFPTRDGVIIEQEMRFDGDDGEYLWRALDIFVIDGDAVIEHTEYCTGCWPPAEITRQADEAPMVRW